MGLINFAFKAVSDKVIFLKFIDVDYPWDFCRVFF